MTNLDYNVGRIFIILVINYDVVDGHKLPKLCYRRLIVNILHGSSGQITEEDDHPSCEIFGISWIDESRR